MGDFSMVPRVLNGGIAATVGAAAVFPLDLVKTRLQNQHVDSAGIPQYSSMFDCFKKTLKHDGVLGLYRGLSINLSLVGLEKGLKLAANDFFRHALSSPDKPLSLVKQGLAGAGAGMIQMCVSCPMELLKIQLQDAGRVAAEAAKRGVVMERKSARSIAAGLFKERGLFGLYRGFVPTAYRDIFFAIIYFPLYSIIHDWGPVDSEGHTKLYWHLNCGLLSGAFCAWISTPFDVVKTRLQAIAKSEGQVEYKGIFDCFGKTLKNEGIQALFKGGACRIIVIAPLYAIAQMVYYIGVAEYVLGYKRQDIVK